jgi:hypothetical protein
VDEEELEPRRKAPKLRDLAPLAIAELAAKRKQRGGAESLFKR